MRKYFIAIAILIFLAAGFLIPRGFGSEEKVIFRIEKREGLGKISANLEKDRLVWWGPFFSLYAIISGSAGKLQAGYYSLDSGMNIIQIANKFSRGEITKETITIPEGFTSQQIYEKLTRTVLASDGGTLNKLADSEGYLFPDTYEIIYGANAEEIIGIMTANFSRKTTGLKITPEIVIMASILEKEVRTSEEKELASDVLWKRLRIGMPLQVDAFIWTYDHLGLPPKPISNPGLESLGAAINPQASPYLYYLSTPDGKTIFSKTLEEHNIAKAKYLTGK